MNSREARLLLDHISSALLAMETAARLSYGGLHKAASRLAPNSTSWLSSGLRSAVIWKLLR